MVIHRFSLEFSTAIKYYSDLVLFLAINTMIGNVVYMSIILAKFRSWYLSAYLFSITFFMNVT